MTDPILATKVLTPTQAGCGHDHEHVLRAQGGLHFIRGNDAPYFSLTSWEDRRGATRETSCASGGAGHERILRFFPQFADLAALHLSDINGAPMHAEANGWYNLVGALGGYGHQYHVGNSKRHFPVVPPADKPWQTTEYRYPTEAECVDLFAAYVRVPHAEALEIIEVCRWAGAAFNGAEARQAARAVWRERMEAMRPRWKADAEACIARHGLIVYGDEWSKRDTVKA